MKDFKSWDESFYTEDYDQEMLNFINSNYSVDYVNGWNVQTSLCQRGGEFFVSRHRGYDKMISQELTKEEFKRKIGMIVEEEKFAGKNAFSKSDLVDGMVVEIRVPFGGISLYLVKGDLLLSKTGHNHLEDYQEDLTLTEGVSEWDIVKVYTVNTFRSLTLEHLNKTLIWERPPEKTQSQLKIEALQQKMESLQEEMNILQKSIESGE